MDLQLIKSPEDLTKLWKTLKNKKITKFYSDKDGNDFAEFSNFYRHESFEFVIPKHLQKKKDILQKSTVNFLKRQLCCVKQYYLMIIQDSYL